MFRRTHSNSERISPKRSLGATPAMRNISIAFWRTRKSLAPSRIRRPMIPAVASVPRLPLGTLATAGIIGRLIRDGAKDFLVRQKAIEIFRIAGVAPKDRLGE